MQSTSGASKGRKEALKLQGFLRSRKDVRWRHSVRIGGWAVLCVIAILIFQLFYQVFPIFSSPSSQVVTSFSLNSPYQASYLRNTQDGQTLLGSPTHCSLDIGVMANQFTPKTLQVPDCQRLSRLLQANGSNYLAQISDSGHLRVREVGLEQIKALPDFSRQLDINVSELQDWHISMSESTLTLFTKSQNLWKGTQFSRDFPEQAKQIDLGDVAFLGEMLNQKFVLAAAGSQLTIYDWDGQALQRITNPKPINFMQVLPHSYSVYLGNESGSLSLYSLVNRDGVFVLEPHVVLDRPVMADFILLQADGNGAMVFTEDNQLYLFNQITGEVVFQQVLSQKAVSGVWDSNQLFLLSKQNVDVWEFSGLASVNTWSSLFSEQRYAGYIEPEYVWQTNNSLDYQVFKFSLIPLLIGSLKASVLALLVAIPLALGAAIYTGFFATAGLRGWLKPNIELIEAIPSVIIGLLAAILLAPLATELLLSVIIFIMVFPIALLLSAYAISKLQKDLGGTIGSRSEFAIVLVFMLLLGTFMWWGLPIVLQSFGDWTTPFASQSSTYKNVLVVALALGIAIAPSIYTLAEDAVHEVPYHLVQASYALGATRLQTLRNVVLAMALPGILSAITLGLGRAFGETMIVLMVTGNTPVADWSVLSGLRTLTANLAIELPESEMGSSHYQVLFLTALILFLFTFILNAFAEWLRSRLRKNYRYV